MEARKKEKNKKQKATKKESKNNNNHIKFDGLITNGIMKGVTISPGSSARITSDFRNYKKAAAAYAAAKGYKHWPSVIETLNQFLRQSARRNFPTSASMQRNVQSRLALKKSLSL